MFSSSDLDYYIETKIQNGLIPGAVVSIFRDKKILHKKAYGYARLYQMEGMEQLPIDIDYLEKIRLCMTRLNQPVKLTTDHLFDVASVTKALAATNAAMLLVDRYQLDLDEPVCRFIPEFNLPAKNKITTRHLLTHTAGLLPWKPIYYHADNLHDVMQYISKTAMQSLPGALRKYSDLGFITLRCLVERVTGQPFNVFLYQHFYQRLNLLNTLFNPGNSHTSIASTSHGNPFEYRMISDDEFGYPCDEVISDFNGWREYTLTGEANDGNAFYALGGVSGHAGLFSTADDIQILLQLLLDQGCYHDQQIISAQTIRKFLTKNEFHHGLGWSMSAGNAIDDLSIGDAANDPMMEGMFGHEGFTGTFILGLPAINAGIIILTNRQNAGVDAAGAYHKLDDFIESVVSIIVNTMLTAVEDEKLLRESHLRQFI